LFVSLNQMCYCYLLWFDTAGKTTLAFSSEQPLVSFSYPGPGKLMTVNPHDPEGVHVLVVIVGSVSPAKTKGQWEQLFTNIGAPPQVVPPHWAGSPEGFGVPRGPGMESSIRGSLVPQSYLHMISSRLDHGLGLETVFAVFFQTSKPAG
jgi:hypothetical protein